MPRVDILAHKVTVAEEEVFDLWGKAIELREPQPSDFAGRVATWGARMEEKYGDSVRPVKTYKQNGPHRVSWVFHEGRDSSTGDPFCTHHIVCDCAVGIESNSPVQITESVVACGAVLQALQRRAAFVDYTYKTTQILDSFRDRETGDFEQSDTFHMIGLRSIVSVLELDARHPDEWPGNIIQGEHRASVLATMLQLHPEVVKWYGKLLEENNVIEDFDGERFRLVDGIVPNNNAVAVSV